MTPSEMEEQIKNLNQWASEVAQYLPLLATKEDLKAFATKEDLKAFATKEELAQVVAKLATKQELADAVARLATRDELTAGLEDAKRYTENLILVTRHEIRQVDDKVTAMAVDVRNIAKQVAKLTARGQEEE